jgi:hypothetical protein
MDSKKKKLPKPSDKELMEPGSAFEFRGADRIRPRNVGGNSPGDVFKNIQTEDELYAEIRGIHLDLYHRVEPGAVGIAQAETKEVFESRFSQGRI